MNGQQMLISRIRYLTFFGFAIASTIISAQSIKDAPTPQELFTRFERYYVDLTVNPDGTYVEEREIATKMLKERAVEYGKQKSITYSTSVQKTEILAAYTQKAGGKRIEAPKGNFQLEVNSGKDKESAAISDYTSLTVIFPDVAVGDTVVLKYRVTTTEAMFPNNFSIRETLSPAAAYDDARFRINLPTSLWTQYSAQNLVETVNTEKDGRRLVEWKYQEKEPMRSKRKDWSVTNPADEIGFSVSTFKSYGDIAEAYGKRANPKTAVTPEIQALAEDVTKGKIGNLEQAKALYEWVARTIHYMGNCVGIGAVVPRDLSFVLTNRTGDCKDHDAILRSLLSAKGIRSVSALINAGSEYTLAKIPVVSSVNHVITYIPEFNRFVDSTSDSTPFDYLPISDSNKPILLAEGYKDGMRTPPSTNNNRQKIKVVAAIAEDGSISGTVDITMTGLFAISGRAGDRDGTAESETEMMKQIFDRDGSGFGFGRIERDDPKPLTDSYKYRLTFKAKEYLNLPGAGAMPISPFWPGVAPVYSLLRSNEYKDPVARETTCLGGSSEEEYEITLPKAMKVLYVPKNVTIKNEWATYTATYKLAGHIVKATRGIVDTTKGNVCPISVQDAFYDFAKKAKIDLKSQILYK